MLLLCFLVAHVSTTYGQVHSEQQQDGRRKVQEGEVQPYSLIDASPACNDMGNPAFCADGLGHANWEERAQLGYTNMARQVRQPALPPSSTVLLPSLLPLFTTTIVCPCVCHYRILLISARRSVQGNVDKALDGGDGGGK
jgi:hypothetical protein